MDILNRHQRRQAKLYERLKDFHVDKRTLKKIAKLRLQGLIARGIRKLKQG